MGYKKPVIGDICEIETPAGLAYVQYTHEDEGMGQLVRVLPGLFNKRPLQFGDLAKERELYFTFYTLEGALRKKQATVVSNQPVPDWAKPLPLMRHPGLEDMSGKPQYWMIFPAGNPLTLEFLKRTPKFKQLSPEQEKLSINALRPHPYMVRRLAEGWTPERAEELRLQAVVKAEEAKSKEPDSDQSSLKQLQHYLYFREKSNAEKAAIWFRSLGFSVEVRRSADDENWLALVKHEPPPNDDEMGRLRAEVESLAAQLGGEYDGWELRV
ncbi:MAG TPA: ribonuclease E inhibitor RraB [Verrucomicrobiae bacterium]|jgi:hypothetical protein|nr:ribonuclease E inhibitor RraB [Verrucomicrobiae bacterium]